MKEKAETSILVSQVIDFSKQRLMWNMTDSVQNFFQGGNPLLSSFVSLLVMGCIALAISLMLNSKSRAMAKLPKNLSVSVFNKTFNVFNPYSDPKKTINRFIFLVPVATACGGLVLASFVMVRIVEMGLVLSIIILITSAALMTMDETFEIYKNAKIFIKAIGNGASLGKGDLDVFRLVKQSLPKLSRYYLSLAVIFIVASATLQYSVPAVFSGFTLFLGAVFSFASSISFLAPFATYFTALFFIMIIIMVQLAIKKAKRRIFEVPSPKA